MSDPLSSEYSNPVDFSSTPPVSFVSAVSSRNAGDPLLGTLISLPPSMAAGACARAGFGWAFIDMEHSPHSAADATTLVNSVFAASKGHCLPIVRVPSHGVEWIKWALDSGAAGIIIPMVNTKAEMEAIVNKALYPPIGARSFGPFQALSTMPPGATPGDYYDRARSLDSIAVLSIIESREGVQNVEEILSVEGVSGTFIGPYDLRLSMGLRGGVDGPEKEFTDAMDKIAGTAKRLGKVCGTMALNAELAEKRAVSQGMGFLLCSLDYSALCRGLATDLNDVRKGLKVS